MAFVSKSTVFSIVSDAIVARRILEAEYQHVDDGEIVRHLLAPFDIGSINPKTRERYSETLFAFSYTHIDKKTLLSDPRICSFNINNFTKLISLDEMFDEVDLAKIHKNKSGYDYQYCRFALLSEREWFSK